MQMEKASSRRRKALRIGTVVGVAAAAVLSSAGPSWAAEETATVSPSSGPTAGGNTVTVNVATQADAGNSFIAGAVGVTLENAADGSCTASLTSAPSYPLAAPANVTVITPTRLAFVAPAASATGGIGGANDYSVCVYSAPGSAPGAGAAAWTLIAKSTNSTTGTYHTGATPVVSSISPRAAGTQGGGTLIVSGSGLGSTTMTLGGTALSLTINGAGTLATAPIPAHAAGGPFSLVVTKTEGGTATLANAFSYANGLGVTPNTASNTRARTDVAVTGSNFGSINFTTTNGRTPDDANGHVYLVKGSYDPAKTGQLKANPQTTECLNVTVIGDGELICSLYLAGGGVPLNSSRQVSGTVSGTTLTSATGNFGPGDVGLTVSGPTSLTANTYITAVLDPTRVTLSKAPTAAISTATTLTLNPVRTFTDATLTNSSNVITSTAGAQFSSADVGRSITGSNISGVTIQSVTSPTSAILSGTASGTASGTYTITGSTAALPEVPVGTYTVTVVNNGSVDAQSTGTFNRSVINSASTFTVADF